MRRLIFRKLHARQVKQLGLGFLRYNLALAPWHTKEAAYKTLVQTQLKYNAAHIWHPYSGTQTSMVETVLRTAARCTCRRRRNTSNVGDMLDKLEWPPSLESRRERSLTFFYKMYTLRYSVSYKDKYLTPSPNLRHTQESHKSQYTRQDNYKFAYNEFSDHALKKSFFPRLFWYSPFFRPVVIHDF